MDKGCFGGSDVMISASLLRASGLVISIFLSNVLVAMVFLLSIAGHKISKYIMH